MYISLPPLLLPASTTLFLPVFAPSFSPFFLVPLADIYPSYIIYKTPPRYCRMNPNPSNSNSTVSGASAGAGRNGGDPPGGGGGDGHNSNSRLAKSNPGRRASCPVACAACRHQRRKCLPNCPMAPYFPAEKQRDFLNVYRFFGVSYVGKQLDKVPPPLKEDCVKSIVYQANARANDLSGGCLRIVLALHAQIKAAEEELSFLHQQLALCRAGSPPQPLPPVAIDDVNGYDSQVALLQLLQQQQTLLQVSQGYNQCDEAALLEGSSSGSATVEELFFNVPEELKRFLDGPPPDRKFPAFPDPRRDFFQSSVVANEDVKPTQPLQENDPQDVASLLSLTNPDEDVSQNIDTEP